MIKVRIAKEVKRSDGCFGDNFGFLQVPSEKERYLSAALTEASDPAADAPSADESEISLLNRPKEVF